MLQNQLPESSYINILASESTFLLNIWKISQSEFFQDTYIEKYIDEHCLVRGHISHLVNNNQCQKKGIQR